MCLVLPVGWARHSFSALAIFHAIFRSRLLEYFFQQSYYLKHLLWKCTWESSSWKRNLMWELDGSSSHTHNSMLSFASRHKPMSISRNFGNPAFFEHHLFSLHRSLMQINAIDNSCYESKWFKFSFKWVMNCAFCNDEIDIENAVTLDSLAMSEFALLQLLLAS